MTKRFYAYIRVSTSKQGEHSSSLAEQKSAIEAFAARNNLTISSWFEEVETAAKRGRRMFSQMMAQLEAGKADGIIIHKIDRSARNLRDWADLGDLIDRGIDVRFVSDNFDLLSRGGRLSADIQAVVAADYIRNLREEVKKGIYGRLKQGLYPFAAPIGYLNSGKGKVKAIDPVKGPLVRYMFERYATNTIAFEQLRHEMWAKGLRTSVGKPLYDNSMTAILNNPFYAGVIRIGTTSETFPGAHEPLITEALFERVQAILRRKTVPKAKKHQFLFRQMIGCGTCPGRHLTGECQKGRLYYRCHGPGCRSASWRGDVLEETVLDQVRRIRIDEQELGDLGDLVREICQERERDTERLRASLALRLRHLDNRSIRLTDLLIDKVIDQPTFSVRKERFLLERQGIIDQQQQADRASPLTGILEKFEHNNNELLHYESLLDDEKRELIEIIGSNFSVSSGSPVFTLRTPYKEIAETRDLSKCAPVRGNVRTKRIADLLVNITEAAISRGEMPHIGPEWHQSRYRSS